MVYIARFRMYQYDMVYIVRFHMYKYGMIYDCTLPALRSRDLTSQITVSQCTQYTDRPFTPSARDNPINKVHQTLVDENRESL